MPLDLYDSPPTPASALGRRRILSKTSGIRVSPLQLGAMSIGDDWKDYMGSLEKEDAFKLLDAFVELGGNFIDTANNYQNEQSETWIGEWMAERKNRDNLVIATKFTINYRSHAVGKDAGINFGGNTRRSLHVSLRDSLKKLQTEYIDILYLHWWDFCTSIEEVMDSLDAVVKSGKVLYLGVSDTPAWIVSACNMYAKAHGKTQFSVYQGRWNVVLRDLERDIIPMCREFGMAISPWDAMGGGKLVTKKQIEKKKADGSSSYRSTLQTPLDEIMSATLAEIAADIGLEENIQAIALAYLMAKTPYVFPIVGGRKVEYLKENIKSLEIKLSSEQIAKIEGVYEFNLGFPMSMLGEDPHVSGAPGRILAASGNIDFLPAEKAIGHQ